MFLQEQLRRRPFTGDESEEICPESISLKRKVSRSVR